MAGRWEPHQVRCRRCGRTISGGSAQCGPRPGEACAWCDDCGRWVQVTGVFVHLERRRQIDASAEYREGEGWFDYPVAVAAGAVAAIDDAREGAVPGLV